jgi:hypothetical protein
VELDSTTGNLFVQMNLKLMLFPLKITNVDNKPEGMLVH